MYTVEGITAKIAFPDSRLRAPRVHGMLEGLYAKKRPIVAWLQRKSESLVQDALFAPVASLPSWRAAEDPWSSSASAKTNDQTGTGTQQNLREYSNELTPPRRT